MCNWVPMLYSEKKIVLGNNNKKIRKKEKKKKRISRNGVAVVAQQV